MIDRYLITPSLHSSWKFYHESETKEKDEFLQTLRREEIQPNEAMLAGRKFEDDIMAACKGEYVDFPGDPTDYDKCVAEITKIVEGGLFQERVMKDFSFRGMNFLLYGKADVIKRDWIRDIKYTRNYDIGKYQGSVQHLIYMYCADMHKFAYHISDGRSVWQEDYFAGHDLVKNLTAELASMLDNILATPEFRELYFKHWKSFS